MIREFLRDENGKLSISRLVVLIATIVFCTAAMANIFSSVSVDSRVYDITQSIFAIGIGGQALRASIKNAKQ